MEAERFGTKMTTADFPPNLTVAHIHDENPCSIHSFDLNEQPPVSPNSSKKRKLPQELVGLPLSKYKFRDRQYGSDDESLSEDSITMNDKIQRISIEWRDSKLVDNGFEHSEESMQGSNSIPGGCAKTVAGKSECSVQEVSGCDQHSAASSEDYYTNYFENSIRSFDSKVLSNSDTNEKAILDSNLEDKTHIGTEIADEHLEFELYTADFIPSETESNDIEQYAGERDEDSMLYSSGSATGGNQIVKKATIDEEFEQYFSMLMI